VQKASRLNSPWLVNDYLDSIMKSLDDATQLRYRRLLSALTATRSPVTFADLARQLPDPPKQIARDVFDLAERNLVQLGSSDPEATKVEITDAGRSVLTSG
jgi:hypothetical protein